MKTKKYLSLLLLLIVSATVLLAFLTNGDYITFLFEGKGLSSRAITGDYEIKQSISNGISSVKFIGGDYEISGISVGSEITKVENDLTNAHCYPNPFRASPLHTKVTFSRLTSHTKLRVYNIAGELVYKTEADTPSGELEWNVIDNDGDPLASELYIYIITDDTNHEKRGKIAIVR